MLKYLWDSSPEPFVPHSPPLLMDIINYPEKAQEKIFIKDCEAQTGGEGVVNGNHLGK